MKKQQCKKTTMKKLNEKQQWKLTSAPDFVSWAGELTLWACTSL